MFCIIRPSIFFFTKPGQHQVAKARVPEGHSAVPSAARWRIDPCGATVWFFRVHQQMDIGTKCPKTNGQSKAVCEGSQ